MKDKARFLFALMLLLFSYSCNEHGRDDFENTIIHGLRPALFTGSGEVTFSLEERMERYNVPAVSIAVIDDMKIRWTKACGVKRKGDTAGIDERTLFQSASVSKPVAAAGAMTLAYRGILPPDAEINTLLKGWQLPYDDFMEGVTVCRILSHSAGLGVGGFGGYGADDTLPGLMEIINGTPPANSPAVRLFSEPGNSFSYSGGGYMIMQKAMEDVTGRTFSSIMQENIFDPLHMENSHYAPLTEEQKKNAAYGHSSGETIPGYGPVHVESAAGGLWTTPTDLSMLMIELMNAWQGNSRKILDSATVRDMLTPRFWDYGLGFKVMGEGKYFRFSHGGATEGWHAHFMAFPERGEGVVIMTNGMNGWMLWTEIERAVAHALGWPNIRAEKIDPYALPDDIYNDYPGEYSMGGWVVRIDKDPSFLTFSGAGLTWSLIPSAVDTFEIADIEGQVFFRRDPNDSVTGLHLWFGEPDWSPYRAWDFEKLAGN